MAAGAFEMIRGSTNSSVGKGNIDEFFMIFFLKLKRMKYGDSQVNTNWFFKFAKVFCLLHFYFSIKNFSFSILIIPLFHFDPCTHISIDDDQRTREREKNQGDFQSSLHSS